MYIDWYDLQGRKERRRKPRCLSYFAPIFGFFFCKKYVQPIKCIFAIRSSHKWKGKSCKNRLWNNVSPWLVRNALCIPSCFHETFINEGKLTFRHYIYMCTARLVRVYGCYTWTYIQRARNEKRTWSHLRNTTNLFWPVRLSLAFQSRNKIGKVGGRLRYICMARRVARRRRKRKGIMLDHPRRYGEEKWGKERKKSGE